MSSNPPTRRGRPPRHDRAALLEIAAAQLLERGFSALRYHDVAEAGSVPVASLRYYFPTITDLRVSALRHLVTDEIVHLEATAEAIEDPWARLIHICTSSISPQVAGRREEWLLWLEFFRAAASDTGLHQQREEVRRRFLALIADCIAKGAREGVFTVDGEAIEVATEVLALIDGYGMRLAMDHTVAEAQFAAYRTERAVRRLLQAADSAPVLSIVGGLAPASALKA
jgi:DNA-binding transcriptional regulator YbjK